MDIVNLSAGILIQIVLGVSLAACAGLRAFLPLLVMSILARTGYIHVHHSFSWIGSIPAIVVFGTATVIEILGDKFPAVDHFLDSVGVIIKPVAGTILFSTVILKMDPLFAVVLGIIMGGTVSELVHIKKTAIRVLSSTLTCGAGNPVLSTAEDVTTGVGIFVSFVAPFIALLFFLIVVFIISKIYISYMRKQKEKKEIELKITENFVKKYETFNY